MTTTKRVGKKVYNQWVQLRNKQEKLASDYEEKSCCEMAYLTLWHVLEEILKIMDAELREKQLYRQVCDWKKYLENPKVKKPGAIISFDITREALNKSILDLPEHDTSLYRRNL